MRFVRHSFQPTFPGPGKRLGPAFILTLLVLQLTATSPAAATDTVDRSFTPRTVHIKVTQVRSGDQIVSGGLDIRLEGIASPPFGTPLGTEAVRFLNTLILHRGVSCRLTGEGFRGSEIGACRLGGKDIAELLLREGLALPCRRLGGRNYAHAADRVKDTGIKDRFTAPEYCGK